MCCFVTLTCLCMYVWFFFFFYSIWRPCAHASCLAWTCTLLYSWTPWLCHSTLLVTLWAVQKNKTSFLTILPLNCDYSLTDVSPKICWKTFTCCRRCCNTVGCFTTLHKWYTKIYVGKVICAQERKQDCFVVVSAFDGQRSYCPLGMPLDEKSYPLYCKEPIFLYKLFLEVND